MSTLAIAAEGRGNVLTTQTLTEGTASVRYQKVIRDYSAGHSLAESATILVVPKSAKLLVTNALVYSGPEYINLDHTRPLYCPTPAKAEYATVIDTASEVGNTVFLLVGEPTISTIKVDGVTVPSISPFPGIDFTCEKFSGKIIPWTKSAMAVIFSLKNEIISASTGTPDGINSDWATVYNNLVTQLDVEGAPATQVSMFYFSTLVPWSYVSATNTLVPAPNLTNYPIVIRNAAVSNDALAWLVHPGV